MTNKCRGPIFLLSLPPLVEHNVWMINPPGIFIIFVALRVRYAGYERREAYATDIEGAVREKKMGFYGQDFACEKGACEY